MEHASRGRFSDLHALRGRRKAFSAVLGVARHILCANGQRPGLGVFKPAFRTLEYPCLARAFKKIAHLKCYRSESGARNEGSRADMYTKIIDYKE